MAPYHALFSPEEVVSDEGGYDYGLADGSAVLADQRLPQLLADAEVDGIGYGLMPPTELQRPLPMLMLVGRQAAPLREAFTLMRNWHEEAGPGAIAVDIAFSGAGYVFALSQDWRALRWRLHGFDNVVQPEAFNIFWTKAIDTRNPFLDQLADYAANAIAPLFLGAAIADFSRGVPAEPDYLDDVAPLLIDKVDIFRTVDEIPPRHVLRHMPGLAPEVGGDEPDPTDDRRERLGDGSALANRREWRLLSVMPKTVHVLRHSEEGQALLARFEAQGFDRWQIEQALANLELSGRAEQGDDPPASHWIEIVNLRPGFVEFASEPVDLARWTDAAIIEQVERDAGYLLRRVDEAPLPALGARQSRLKELGLVAA